MALNPAPVSSASGAFPVVVIDSSTALATVLPGETYAIQAAGLMGELDAASARLIAPVLWEIETDSPIRLRAQFKKTISLSDEITLQAAIDALDVEIVYDPAIRARTRQLAARLNLIRTYDATYLALADLQGALFWTGDERLFNAVSHALPYVRCLKFWTPGHSLK